MKFFYQLLAVVVLTLVAVLGWDLSKRHIQYGDKEVIIYAGMFGPGEPMQLLFSGPPASIEPDHPFGADAHAHYAALMAAWPDRAARVREQYGNAFGRPLPAQRPQAATPVGGAAAPTRPGEFESLPLAEQYRRLDRRYVERLIEAIGQRKRSNRLELFRLFAELHPAYDARMIQTFETAHPAYTVGLFEDFRRRNPNYEIVERWDGRWVLSANRPRFLTGTDVPDLIAGSFLELRILYQENLALPLDQPLPAAANAAWREKGILDGTPAYNDPSTPVKQAFQQWALEASTYTVTREDVEKLGHPYAAGTRIVYLWPSICHAQVVFYNRAHFRRIGRDGDAAPRTVEEFEEICRKLLAAGVEPIAQDGTVYIENWWSDMVNRVLGYETYYSTCRGDQPRFAGLQGEPRYLEIARRLRGWRDESFWMKGFSASKWPGAQRDFGTGRCTFLFTGTWLPAEIAETRSRDLEVFDLSCFIFPAVTGGTGNPRQIGCGAQGHAVTRQGRNPEGAVRLLNYLGAYGAELESSRLHYVSAHRGVAFPPEAAALEPILAAARPGDIITEGIQGALPKFNKFVLGETFSKFFVVRSDNLTPEEFVETLERKAQEHYVRYGKGT